MCCHTGVALFACWGGSIICTPCAFSQHLTGSTLKTMAPGKAHLWDGGFGGRRGSNTPYPKPVRSTFSSNCTAGVCAGTPRANMGLPFRIASKSCIGWCALLVYAQPFLNALNVRYDPCGAWDHFPSAVCGQPKVTQRHTDSDLSSSSASSSGSSLCSEDQDEDTDENEEA